MNLITHSSQEVFAIFRKVVVYYGHRQHPEVKPEPGIVPAHVLFFFTLEYFHTT